MSKFSVLQEKATMQFDSTHCKVRTDHQEGCHLTGKFQNWLSLPAGSFSLGFCRALHKQSCVKSSERHPRRSIHSLIGGFSGRRTLSLLCAQSPMKPTNVSSPEERCKMPYFEDEVQETSSRVTRTEIVWVEDASVMYFRTVKKVSLPAERWPLVLTFRFHAEEWRPFAMDRQAKCWMLIFFHIHRLNTYELQKNKSEV